MQPAATKLDTGRRAKIGATVGRKTGDITSDLKARRKRLLKRYDAEDLHQLRVDIRRLRSALKLAGTDEALRLRKAWGRIAGSTNPARDWDTFAQYTEKALEPERQKAIEPLLAHQLHKVHKQVEKTLLSPRWSAALGDWKTYESRKIAAPAPEPAFASRVEPARRRVDAARALALARGDEASWHGLRIAVKELRYTLDNLRPEHPPEQRQLRAGIGLCKQLQAELGDWHDTVIHAGLVEKLARAAIVNEDGPARETLQVLSDRIHRHGIDCLAAARGTLDADGTLLAPPQEGGLALGYEIEKKFLVDPQLLGALEHGEQIVQGFVETRNAAAVRVRLAGERAWLTLKGPSRGGVRSEFEYQIPPEDARRILDELCGHPVITKTRYRIDYRGYTWEIDVFEEENKGLIVAEVELGRASDRPELPPWVTEEVTGDPRYYNVNLARHPFSGWREE